MKKFIPTLPFACFFAMLFLLFSGKIQAQTQWTEAAQSLGIFHQTVGSNYGSGACFYDFNGDGRDDLTLGSGTGDSISFYVNTGTGFQKIPSLVPDVGETKQVLWVDYDNDGDKDLFTTSDMGGNHLYQNHGNLTFTDVTPMADLPTDSMPTWTAAFGDYDRDGWLDLYVTNYVFGTAYNYSNYLFKNAGNGTFQNATQIAQVADSNKSPLAIAFFDYDNDHWPDIFIAQDKFHGNVLFHNEGNGSFEDVSVISNANQAMDGMSAAVGDYNKDGYSDLYITNSPWGNLHLENNTNGTFTNVTSTMGTGFFGEGWAATFYDFDNDTWQDLYVSGAFGGSGFPSAAYYHNTGTGTFSQPTNVGLTGDTTQSYSHAVGDVDNDGYPDIIVNNRMMDSTILWLNNGSGKNWVKISLEGTASNRDGIGSRIEVWCNGDRQVRTTHCGIGFLAQNTSYEMVGLNQHTSIDSLLVYWPSGHKTTRLNVPANQVVTIVEGDDGPVVPQIFKSGSDALCAGQNIKLYTPRFSNYLWSTGDTTASIWVNQPGSYWVRATDANGVTSTSDTFHLTMRAPVFDLVIQEASCFGASDGFATLQNPAGTYTYQWNPSATGDSLTQLPAGTYSVAVTDTEGCTLNRSFYVGEPPQLLVSTSSTPDIGNVGSGSASATPTGGIPPYTFLWDDPQAQTTATASGLFPGSYRVVVTDSNGCTTADTVEVSFLSQIEPDQEAAQVRVYPNPTHDVLTLESDHLPGQWVSLQLTGVEGKVYRAQRFRATGSHHRLDLHDLVPGVYFLRVETEGVRHHGKVLVQ